MMTIIQANPGFKVCYLDCDPPHEYYWLQEVIAWRLDDEDLAADPDRESFIPPMAITAEGGCSNPCFIVDPSGRCFNFDHSWDTLEDAVKSMRAKLLEKVTPTSSQHSSSA